jgi:tRNA G10  N-methylase Trm11
MTQHLFVFGRTPDLAIAELNAILPSVTSLSRSVATAETTQDPHALIGLLGGTVKIAVVERTLPEVTADVLAQILSVDQKTHIDFGISWYDVPPQDILKQVKEILTKKGISARFVIAKHEDALSSVVVAKQKVTELIVCHAVGGGYTIGRTVAVQDFEEWNRRDYDRPAADPKSGMLPPKVSRMVVNIAFKGQKDKILLDPFCGMGTILAEGLLSGVHVVGIDLSSSAIDGAKKNLEWLASAYPETKGQWQLFAGDATHASEHVEGGSIDAIVTEPFMGATLAGGRGAKMSGEAVKNTIKGLEKLYIGCLRDWHGILVSGGIVVIALPEYQFGDRRFFVKTVIDSCERLGYTPLAGPIEYSRPQAVVRRKFFVLRKN